MDASLAQVALCLSCALVAGALIERRGGMVPMRESGLQRVAERLKETPGRVEFDLAKLAR
ncbi:MAG TPA: hypothetical protein VMT68_00895 [Caulobacteraceae bacterium]|nr:hypothetical protein [Caulobacteraceae bacterium]